MPLTHTPALRPFATVWNFRRNLIALLCFSVLVAGAAFAQAQSPSQSPTQNSSKANEDEAGYKRVGDYEVFYSAFNTSFLTPEVASAINVVRADNRGLVNISLRKIAEGDSQPVKVASISGTRFDLLHRTALSFQEVIEPGAIYYLAPFRISNDNETIHFDIQISPAEGEAPIEISIKRAFFHND